MKHFFTAILFCVYSLYGSAQTEINVLGNGNTITDGDATPSFGDWTEYTSILECTGTVVRSYIIQNIGTADLHISSVTISGPEASDFSITGVPAATILPGTSSSIQVTFNPLGVGPRNATITINNDDADESVYDFALRGTGMADVVNPTIFCPASISTNSTTGLCSAVVTFTTPTATDNCPAGAVITQTAGLPSGSVFPVGVTVNTFQATDGSGNSSTCSFSVTVTDAQAPTLYTMSTIATSNAAGGAYSDGWQNGDNDGSGFGAWILAASTGNSAQAGFFVGSSITNGSGTDSNGDGDINTSATAWGMYANSAQATQATRPLSVPLAVGNTLRVEFDNGAVDNGQIVGFQMQNAAGQSLGEVRLRGNQPGYELVDVNGITPFTSVPFTDEGIVIEVTPAVTGQSSIKLTRKVDGAAQTLTSVMFAGGGDQVIRRIMIFNSNAGSGTSKNLFVNKLQVLAVTPGCPANINVSNNTGTCGATVVYNAVLATDNCASSLTVTQTAGLPSGSVFPVGTTINSFSSTDASGNTTTCSFNVVVADTTDPVANCRNLSLYLNASGNAGIIAAMVNNGSADNCGIASMSVAPTNFSCGSIGTNTVTLTVNDASGNSSTCNAVVTVLDSTHPVITVNPGPQSLSASGCSALMPDYSSLVSATDNCGTPTLTQISPLPGSGVSLGSTVNVTVRATDASGNSTDCVFPVTVVGPEAEIRFSTVVIPDGNVGYSTTNGTDFGNVMRCSGSVVHTFTIYNLSSTTSLSGISVMMIGNVGDFSITAQPPTSIAPLQSATFQVTFDPQNAGFTNAIVQVSSNECDENPYNFQIGGFGDDPEINVKGNATSISNGDITPSFTDHTDFGSVLTCTGTIVRTYTIENTGNINLTVGTPTITGTNAGDFALFTAPAPLVAPGGSITFSVRFDPAADGLRSALITVPNGDCDEGTYSFAIQGTGNADVVNPVVNCQNTTVYLGNVSGSAMISPAMVTASASDNCGIASLNLSQTTFTCTNVGPNNVTLTATDFSGNSSVCSTVVTVIDSTKPIVNTQNITVYLNASGSATIIPAMINNGSTDACGIASMTVVPNAFTCANTGANTVALTVTDVNGNVASSTAIVTVADTVHPVAIAQNITVTLSGGTATVSPSMINNGSSDACGIASMTVSPSTFTCSELGPNPVTLVVTDVNGNSSSVAAIVTVISDFTSTASVNNNVSCFGGSDGQASISTSGGAGPFTYAWLPSGGTASTATGLSAGSYTVTATDGGGCTTSSTMTITQPFSGLNASSVSGIIPCTGGTTTVTVTGSGGTAPYNGTGTFVVTTGTYSYAVTDANGCSTLTSVTVTEPAALSAVSSSTSILCNGGTATVTVSGTGGTAPYSDDGIFIVNAGTYSYTITDANGCTATTTITITEPAALAPSVAITNVGCNGDSTGSIDLTVSGGTAPYTYDWNNGTYTTEDISGLGAGSYTGVLTDANGCTIGGTFILTEPAVLAATVATLAPTTCNGADGAVDLTVTGGTGPYAFLWNNAATTEDLASLSAGTYSCTVTDSNGCATNASAVLNDPNAPVVTFLIVSDTVCLDDGAFTITGENPAGGIFSGPGVSGAVFTAAAAGIGTHALTYTYTDVNGCTGTAVDSVNVDACLGYKESADEFYAVYPNPNNGNFVITGSATSVATASVYDAQGKLIERRIVQPGVQEQFYLQESGIYLLTVETYNGNRATHRVIVNR